MFLKKLTTLNDSDDISVYWDGDGITIGDTGTLYINDESDNQVVEYCTLYEAYRFAVLINASYFDYVALDKIIKEFSKQLLELVDEEYKIDIWEYLDDIAEDFKTLTDGAIINDIDIKRGIVCCMTDMGEHDGLAFGSATYIARILSNTIIGCKNETIIDLHDKYLKTDEYNLLKFAEELHKKAKTETKINIRGSLWINNAKYEYVDYIIVTREEVEIYQQEFQIGSIERDKINTIEEQYVELNEINNLKDVLDFDITKVGDF